MSDRDVLQVVITDGSGSGAASVYVRANTCLEEVAELRGQIKRGAAIYLHSADFARAEFWSWHPQRSRRR